MILFFSATGNSEHVARSVASATGDAMMSIERFDAAAFAKGMSEGPGQLGLVCPVYAWGLPTPVIGFLRATRLLDGLTADGEKPYTFVIVTYGSTTGQAARFAGDLLREQGVGLDAAMSVKMPDTWTPIFDLSDAKKVAEINKAAETEISAAVDAVIGRKRGDATRHKVPLPAAWAYHELGLPVMERTRNFRVDAECCVGCGLCAKLCPMKAIQMRGGLPAWSKPRCAACLRCLHRCPKFAISYGKRTAGHGQYVHP